MYLKDEVITTWCHLLPPDCLLPHSWPVHLETTVLAMAGTAMGLPYPWVKRRALVCSGTCRGSTVEPEVEFELYPNVKSPGSFMGSSQSPYKTKNLEDA